MTAISDFLERFFQLCVGLVGAGGIIAIFCGVVVVFYLTVAVALSVRCIRSFLSQVLHGYEEPKP